MYLAAYNEQSTYSSVDFLKKAYAFFKHSGFTMKCIQTDNGLNAPTVSHAQPATCSCSLKKPLPISASGTSSSGLTRLATTVRRNAAIARISAVSTTRILSIRSPISMFSQLDIEDPPITALCILYTITRLLLFFALIPSNLFDDPEEKDGYAERLQMWKKKEAEAKGANPATPQPQTE